MNPSTCLGTIALAVALGVASLAALHAEALPTCTGANSNIKTSPCVDARGNVGIGTSAPAAKLHVVSPVAGASVLLLQNGTGSCTFTAAAAGSGIWSCSSDARLKKDVADTTARALEWADTMRIRDYTMKSDGSRQTGVIAQELIGTHPDMVHKGSDGTYTVDQPNTWIMIRAIQELHALVGTYTNAQKAADERHAADINALRDELSRLKQAVGK